MRARARRAIGPWRSGPDAGRIGATGRADRALRTAGWAGVRGTGAVAAPLRRARRP